MMHDLGDDALALIRAARGGDEPSADERARVLAAFRAERELGVVSKRDARRADPDGVGVRLDSDEERVTSERSRGGLLLPERSSSARLGPSRRLSITWSLAALISLASVGAFADWRAVADKVRVWTQYSLDPASGSAAERAEPEHERSRSSVARPRTLPSEGDEAPLNPQPEMPSVSAANEPQASVAQPTSDAASGPSLSARSVDSSPSTASTSVAVPAQRVPLGAAPEVDATEPGSSGREPSAQRARSLSIDAELALISRARDALSASRHAEALELTRTHARDFASGALLEERRAIEALAQCRSGHGPSAGRAFVLRWPDSLFTPRVNADCGLQNSVPFAASPGTDPGNGHEVAPRKESNP